MTLKEAKYDTKFFWKRVSRERGFSDFFFKKRFFILFFRWYDTIKIALTACWRHFGLGMRQAKTISDIVEWFTLKVRLSCNEWYLKTKKMSVERCKSTSQWKNQLMYIVSLVLRKDVVVIPEVIIFYVLIIENIFMIDCYWMVNCRKFLFR